MGAAEGRLTISAVRPLLDDTQALIEGASTSRVCALMVEPHIGGVRRATEQHNQTRYQKYENRSHESHSIGFPGTIAAKTKGLFSGPALFTNAVKFLRISQSGRRYRTLASLRKASEQVQVFLLLPRRDVRLIGGFLLKAFDLGRLDVRVIVDEPAAKAGPKCFVSAQRGQGLAEIFRK
jgi:hypothetical protein